MIIQRIRPLANDHPEDPATCKWSSGGTGLLQMITRHDMSPKSPLPGSRFNLADLSRTICSCLLIICAKWKIAMMVNLRLSLCSFWWRQVFCCLFRNYTEPKKLVGCSFVKSYHLSLLWLLAEDHIAINLVLSVDACLYIHKRPDSAKILKWECLAAWVMLGSHRAT